MIELSVAEDDTVIDSDSARTVVIAIAAVGLFILLVFAVTTAYVLHQVNLVARKYREQKRLQQAHAAGQHHPHREADGLVDCQVVDDGGDR